MSMAKESVIMRILRKMRFERLAWSLRRFHCPVSRDALVLEVGSGGNPYPRANVLLDAYEVTRERHWAPLVADRPTVLGLAENLPFRDKAFDFVIASHVLEHSADPERFIAELQRVAKAGYIEVPDAFMERINPYLDHRLEVTVRDDCLIIRKKDHWLADAELVDLYENRAKHWVTKELIPRHPFDFHVRYYWSEHVRHEILNPQVDATWAAPKVDQDSRPKMSGGGREIIRQVTRRLFSQQRRNRQIDLMALLRCPCCGEDRLAQTDGGLTCTRCESVYPVVQGIPRLFPDQKR